MRRSIRPSLCSGPVSVENGNLSRPADWACPNVVPLEQGRQQRQRTSSPGGHDFPSGRPRLTIAPISGHWKGDLIVGAQKFSDWNARDAPPDSPCCLHLPRMQAMENSHGSKNAPHDRDMGCRGGAMRSLQRSTASCSAAQNP